MEIEYDCPYHDCSGKLRHFTTLSTDMYTLPYDRNIHSEQFICEKCKAKFVRHWEWKETQWTEQ